VILTRDGMTEAGREMVLRFCRLNGIPAPKLPTGSVVANAVRSAGGSCGLYHRGTIYVDPPACARLGYGGPAWSWPGYIIDRTPYGVHAHELGHYVADQLRLSETTLRRKSGEMKLTNYCPNAAEWLAEMFRLFVTNPSLLRGVRPATYSLFVGEGLKPVEKRNWRLVLASAPTRTLAMAERRIKEQS
jgi:hypothetical protein